MRDHAAMTKRPRTARRATEREQTKLTEAWRKLHALEPGGSEENPVEVVSASVIEPHARSLACARCGPELRIVDQAAFVKGAHVRRVMSLRCARCGEARSVHYVIVQSLLQ
jgi:hypothetical protein